MCKSLAICVFWLGLILYQFLYYLLPIKIVHSILELFNFLLWKSASVYCIAGFVYFLNSHKKWYCHQNIVEFKETVAIWPCLKFSHWQCRRMEWKYKKRNENFTVNEFLTYCFTCPCTFNNLIFLTGTSTAEVWESQVRQSAT